jgi:Protein of unknown function (DUF998)
VDAPERAGQADSAPGVPAFAAVSSLVAAISYSTFVLESWLSPDLDVLNGYVSELSASDQPYHLVYGAGDAITGALVIVVALTALRHLPSGPWWTLGWTCLGLFGAAAVGDALFPLDCAPSLESTCALRERSGHVSFSHQFHAVTSTTVVIFGIGALVALSVAARRAGRLPALARWGLPLGLAEALVGCGTLVAMLMGQWLGVVQRVQIVILCTGLLVIARALDTDRRARRRDPVDPPSTRERAPS